MNININIRVFFKFELCLSCLWLIYSISTSRKKNRKSNEEKKVKHFLTILTTARPVPHAKQSRKRMRNACCINNIDSNYTADSCKL